MIPLCDLGNNFERIYCSNVHMTRYREDAVRENSKYFSKYPGDWRIKWLS